MDSAASTRIRKAFRYPTDNDINEPEALDEQEQEQLIEELKTRNESTNSKYKLAFLALPLLSLIPWLPLLFTRHKLRAVLSITSLLSTAYLFHTLPAGVTGLPLLDHRDRKHTRSQNRAQQRESLSFDSRGPLLRYLPLLNLSLGATLLLWSIIKDGISTDAQFLNILPLGIYLFMLVVKNAMGSVDVEELAALKYNYKGA